MLYGLTFLLAFCSIVYELLLGQALAAFLGNTVLRYSVTIGLFLLAKGIGAWLAEGRVARHPITSLLTLRHDAREVYLSLLRARGPGLTNAGAQGARVGFARAGRRTRRAR